MSGPDSTSKISQTDIDRNRASGYPDLDAKRKTFCRLYLESYNQRDAASKAKFPPSRAALLLREPLVQAFIKDLESMYNESSFLRREMIMIEQLETLDKLQGRVKVPLIADGMPLEAKKFFAPETVKLLADLAKQTGLVDGGVAALVPSVSVTVNGNQPSGSDVASMTEEQIEEQLFVVRARRNFWEYRKYMNPKMRHGWWQENIAGHLQKFYEDYVAKLRPKLVVQAPPQHGKSSLVTDFISWFVGQDPSQRTIYGSFSERLGKRANLRLQRIMTSPKYKRIFPGVVIPDGKGESRSYQCTHELIEFVGQEGYFRNTTVLGAVTGESLDLGVIDDPIKGREQANSRAIRDKTWDWMTDDFFTRFSDEAALLMIMTRWHLDDPAGRLLAAEAGVKIVYHPALSEPGCKLMPDDPRVEGSDEPLFPELKSKEFLAEKRAIMWEPSWQALYQQNPMVNEGNLFKPDAIAIVDAVPQGVQMVRGWDFASVSDGGDYTAGFKLGKQQNGRFIILDVARLRGSPDEVEAALVNTAGRDGTNTQISIPQDPGQAGKSQVSYFIKKLGGYSVTATPESGDKITRAEPFASQVNVGNVDMLRADWNDALIDEMRFFPNGKNDDQIDAGSRAFDKLHNGIHGLFDFFQQETDIMKQAQEAKQ